jgi:hypothetical protein
MTLIAQAVRFAGLSHSAVLLLKWLADYSAGKPMLREVRHTDDEGRTETRFDVVFSIRPHHAPTLAEFARLHPGRSGKTSERSAQRWLRELVEAGLVETLNTGRNNGYYLIIPPEAIAHRKVRKAVEDRKRSILTAFEPAGVVGPDPTGQATGHPTVQARHPTGQNAHPTVQDAHPTGVSSHRSSDKTDKTHHTHPTRSAHSIQEPAEPIEAGVGGGGGGESVEVRKAGQAVREAVETTIVLIEAVEREHPRDLRAQKAACRSALGRLTGVALTLTETDLIETAIRRSVEACHRSRTGEASTPDSIKAAAQRRLTEAGLTVDDPQAALEALQSVGVSGRMIDRLIGSTTSKAIVEAVRQVRSDPKVSNPAGAVVSMLDRRERIVPERSVA